MVEEIKLKRWWLNYFLTYFLLPFLLLLSLLLLPSFPFFLKLSLLFLSNCFWWNITNELILSLFSLQNRFWLCTLALNFCFCFNSTLKVLINPILTLKLIAFCQSKSLHVLNHHKDPMWPISSKFLWAWISNPWIFLISNPRVVRQVAFFLI